MRSRTLETTKWRLLTKGDVSKRDKKWNFRDEKMDSRERMTGYG